MLYIYTWATLLVRLALELARVVCSVAPSDPSRALCFGFNPAGLVRGSKELNMTWLCVGVLVGVVAGHLVRFIGFPQGSAKRFVFKFTTERSSGTLWVRTAGLLRCT